MCDGFDDVAVAFKCNLIGACIESSVVVLGDKSCGDETEKFEKLKFLVNLLSKTVVCGKGVGFPSEMGEGCSSGECNGCGSFPSHLSESPTWLLLSTCIIPLSSVA